MLDLSAVISEMLSEIFGKNLMNYWLGVLLAILSGIFSNIGAVLQKMVVNKVPDEAKLMRSLIKNPIWVLGLISGMGVGAALFMLAQYYIGPTLIPGLMAAGLIVLAIGSVKIIGEELEVSEIIGIFLMIAAIAFIGFSGMDINIDLIDFLNIDLITRITIFTITLFIFALICEIFQRRGKYKGIFLANLSGSMFALSNFWISPLFGTIAHVLSGRFIPEELLIFIIAAIILVSVNILGITKIQEAFRVAKASHMVPIQQVPIQIMPPFYFIIVYLLPLPNLFSILFLTVGIGLVLISSYSLARRQAELEKIK
ncbi:MAG: DMT family transporter [Candidatus Hodarchaeota archaeon]